MRGDHMRAVVMFDPALEEQLKGIVNTYNGNITQKGKSDRGFLGMTVKFTDQHDRHGFFACIDAHPHSEMEVDACIS